METDEDRRKRPLVAPGGSYISQLEHFRNRTAELEAHNKALREALEGMLEAYAPGADTTVANYGETALHSSVRKARQALAATKEGGGE